MRIPNINFREASTNGGRTRTAIFIYTGPGDPVPHLRQAVSLDVLNEGYNEFIDANMDNPWVGVIIFGLNDMGRKVLLVCLCQLLCSFFID